MSKRIKISEEDIVRAKEIMQSTKDIREMRGALTVLLAGSFSLSLEAIGEFIGRSRATVAREKKVFQTGRKVEGWGGRRRSYLSFAEEEEFLRTFADNAAAGEFVVINEIKAGYESKVGHEISESTVYRLLSRHGWRKVAPRRRHPKSDQKVQDEFKKNFKWKWMRKRSVV